MNVVIDGDQLTWLKRIVSARLALARKKVNPNDRNHDPWAEYPDPDEMQDRYYTVLNKFKLDNENMLEYVFQADLSDDEVKTLREILGDMIDQRHWKSLKMQLGEGEVKLREFFIHEAKVSLTPQEYITTVAGLNSRDKTFDPWEKHTPMDTIALVKKFKPVPGNVFEADLTPEEINVMLSAVEKNDHHTAEHGKQGVVKKLRAALGGINEIKVKLDGEDMQFLDGRLNELEAEGGEWNTGDPWEGDLSSEPIAKISRIVNDKFAPTGEDDEHGTPFYEAELSDDELNFIIQFLERDPDGWGHLLPDLKKLQREGISEAKLTLEPGELLSMKVAASKAETGYDPFETDSFEHAENVQKIMAKFRSKPNRRSIYDESVIADLSPEELKTLDDAIDNWLHHEPQTKAYFENIKNKIKWAIKGNPRYEDE